MNLFVELGPEFKARIERAMRAGIQAAVDGESEADVRRAFRRAFERDYRWIERPHGFSKN